MSVEYVSAPTDRRILTSCSFWTRRGAEHEAERLNAERVMLTRYGAAFEWRVVERHGLRRFAVAAFQNRLVQR